MSIEEQKPELNEEELAEETAGVPQADEQQPANEAPVGDISDEEIEQLVAGEAPAPASESAGDFSRANYVPPKRKKKTGRKVALIIVIVLVVLIAGCCAALGIDDYNRTKHVPANTTLDGTTDITGMTAAQVSDAARQHVADGTARGITLVVGPDTYELAPSQVGEADSDATAQAALDLYDDLFLRRWIQRIQMLFFDAKPGSYDINTACTLNEGKVRSAIIALKEVADCEPTDAGYDVNEDNTNIVPREAHVGVVLDVDATVAAIMRVAQSDDFTGEVEAVAELTEAQNQEIGQGMFIDTVACHLYFYDNGELQFDCDCTPGMTGTYATPTGDFYIDAKDPSPTWYNPHQPWSEDMAESIPPGRSNPLGLRALSLSCGAAYFVHGTINDYQLGTRASHGCVRVSNDNILTLFDMVEIGCLAFIR